MRGALEQLLVPLLERLGGEIGAATTAAAAGDERTASVTGATGGAVLADASLRSEARREADDLRRAYFGFLLVLVTSECVQSLRGSSLELVLTSLLDGLACERYLIGFLFLFFFECIFCNASFWCLM